MPKLFPKYSGPFQVLKKYGNSYQLKLPSTWWIYNVFHVSLLRPFHESLNDLRDPEPPPPDPILIDGTEEFQVEKILAERLYYQK